MLESTTNKVFAETPEDLENRYPYQYWIPDAQCLILSKVILDGDDLSASNGIQIKNPTTGAWVTTSTTTYYTLYTTTYSNGDFLRLYYNDVTGWEAWLPDMVRRATTNTTIYYSAYGSGTLPSAVFTNGTSIPAPFTSGGTSLPSNIPPFDNVQEAINNALNASTGTTTQANQIQSTVNTNLDSYKNGDITSSEMQDVINTAVSDLENLNQNSTNTLADQIAINNALTATQTAQDQVLSNDLIESLNDKFKWGLSENISASQLTSAIEYVLSSIYNSYLNGETTKQNAISEIMEYQYSIVNVKTEILDSGGIWTEANEAVLDDLRELTKQYQDNINNSGDVDPDIAESANASMESEMQFVDSLISETTASLEDLTPSLDDSDSEKALQWIGLLWDNEFFKMVLPWCAIAMLVCLVLGVRYRT